MTENNFQKGLRWRMMFVYGAFLLLSLAILGSIVKIQLIDGKEWRNKAKNISTKYREINAVRGNIYSSDGALLSTSVPIYDVRFDAVADAVTDELFNKSLRPLSRGLAQIFGDKSTQEYMQILRAARKRKDRYFLVKRGINFNELQAVKELPLFNRGRFKGGVIYEKQTKRVKPFGVLAYRTIGYEREGTNVGIEGAYNRILSGSRGMRLEQKLAGGAWMPLEDNNEIEPQDGLDVISTIDINIQDVATKALERQLIKNNAKHGCVVLMEVASGKIRAIANLGRSDDGVYRERYNYAVGEATEPGSTFKLATILAALDDGFVSPEDSVDTFNGKVKYYDTYMTDSRQGGYGVITTQRAFEVSSNIGISQIISKHYKDDPVRFTDKLQSFGLNKPLAVEIFGEGKPRIGDPRSSDWSGISLTQMAIGYEVLLTPLQILAFYNAVANDGVLVKPLFAEGYSKNGEMVERFKPTVLNSGICSKSAIRAVKNMLEGVVENGTAQNLKAAQFKIAGKTGTARLANDNSGYSDEESKYTYQASFAGYFPAENPKYSCIVVVNAPSNSVYYGNLVAGPIFKEVADKVYSTQVRFHEKLNAEEKYIAQALPPSVDGNWADLKTVYNDLNLPYALNSDEKLWVKVKTQTESIKVNKHPTRLPGSNLVPNVVGMGLKDAIYLLENSGLNVKVKGVGTVKWQDVAPGTKTYAGTQINILLD